MKEILKKFKLSFRFESLQTKVFIVLTVVLTMVLLPLGMLIYSKYSKDEYRNFTNLSQQVAIARADEVGTLIHGLGEELHRISQTPELVSMNWSTIEPILEKISKERSEIFSMVFLIYPDGSYYVPKKGKISKNLKDRDYFIAIFNENSPIEVTNPSISRSTGEKKFSIAVPVIDSKNKVVGSLCVNVSLSKISEIAASIKIGKESSSYIIDNEGIYVAHKIDSLTLVGNIANLDSAGYKGINDLVKSMNSTKEGAHDIFDNSGNGYLTVFSKIPSTKGWVLAIEMPHHEIMKSVHDFRIYIITSFFIVLIITLAAMFWLNKKILISPIQKLSEYIKSMSLGYFDSDIKVNSKDEVGKMSQEIIHMQDQIASITNSIIESSQSVENTASEVKNAASGLADGVSQQASAIEQVSAAIEEMTSAINQNSDNAIETEKIASRANNDITHVLESLIQTTDSLKIIVEKTKIIHDIAKKTDLLALNASIEAARAEQFGKGFAVVADGVKKLAEQSQIAANEINSITQMSLNKANESCKMLEEVVPVINQTTILVKEIASSTSEQSSGAHEINNALQQLNSVVYSNSSSSEQLSSSSDNLLLLSENLRTVLEFFKKRGSKADIDRIKAEIENHKKMESELNEKMAILLKINTGL